MAPIIYPVQHTQVTCPACGLLCDDLAVNIDSAGKASVTANGCIKAVHFFERTLQAASPQINGKPSTLVDACNQAAKLLKQANAPLIAGLGTEVQGMRAILRLADRTGATLDHMNSASSMRNTHVVQNTGWQVTTLTEVRNRVDLLVIVGSDIVDYNPRFFERVVWNKESMFGLETAQREIVYLGGQNLNTAPGISPSGKQPTVLPCDQEKLPEVTAALRAIVMGKKLDVSAVAGIAINDLQALAERLKAAKYGVVTWVSSAFDFAHAELAIQNLTEMIVKLNAETRCSGLPLGGSEGDYSVNQTSTWISGYPVRNGFKRGHPEFDPYLLSTDKLLETESVDALLWISTFNPEKTPPATVDRPSLPVIVIGHPNMQLAQTPAVFIPVAVPGVEHTGTMFRIDSSVSLPLKQLKNAEQPSLSQVIEHIEAALLG